MAPKLADDGIGFNWIDKAVLWLLPAFLSYVGFKVEGFWVAMVGLMAGIAVVRGVQAGVSEPAAGAPGE